MVQETVNVGNMGHVQTAIKNAWTMVAVGVGSGTVSGQMAKEPDPNEIKI